MGKNIKNEIADALLEVPIGLEIGGQHFLYYPATLGQTLITEKILSVGGFKPDKFQENPLAEAMRFSTTNRDDVIRIIAVNLLRGKDATNKVVVDKFFCKLKDIMDKAEVATMLITVLTRDNNAMTHFIKETELLHDREDLKRINAVKESKSTFLFGRRTVYGQVIDAVCNRYGWTMDYVLWGISYVNIQMLLADMEVSVYLSDKEMKRVHISNSRDIVNGDDPSMRERIMAEFNE